MCTPAAFALYAYFRTGDFKKKRPYVPFYRGTKYCLRHVVGNAADIDRRNGKSAEFFTAHGHVKGLDRCRPDSLRSCAAANQKTCRFLNIWIGTENDRID